MLPAQVWKLIWFLKSCLERNPKICHFWCVRIRQHWSNGSAVEARPTPRQSVHGGSSLTHERDGQISKEDDFVLRRAGPRRSLHICALHFCRNTSCLFAWCTQYCARNFVQIASTVKEQIVCCAYNSLHKKPLQQSRMHRQIHFQACVVD